MLAMNSAVHSVPEVRFQTDQVTKQPNLINLHGRTLPHVDSMEYITSDRWLVLAL